MLDDKLEIMMLDLPMNIPRIDVRVHWCWGGAAGSGVALHTTMLIDNKASERDPSGGELGIAHCKHEDWKMGDQADQD